MTEITYAAVNRVLRESEATQDAAEFHGTLCGRLCAVEESSPLPKSDVPPLLEQLQHQTLSGLRDAASGFQPLLPDDGSELLERVQALAQWCAGFVFGLGCIPDLDLQMLSEDAQEMVSDMTEISRADASVDDAESEEAAYAEVVEYVRVGAQLVFLEIHGMSGNQGTPTLH